MPLRPEDLLELRDKYEELLRLRAEHAAPHPPDPRPALRALAARFPGALRELDDTPLPALQARLAKLERCSTAGEEAPPWALVMHHFHGLARGILATKRWLARAPAPENAHDAFAEALATGALPPEAQAWHSHLEAIAHPPRGRLMPLVYGAIAERLGLPVGEVLALVLCKSSGTRAGG